MLKHIFECPIFAESKQLRVWNGQEIRYLEFQINSQNKSLFNINLKDMLGHVLSPGVGGGI